MKIFQFALIWIPTEKQIEDDGAKPKLIAGVKDILANDDKHAATIAARAIPEEYADQLDQVTVAIRPF
jgi:hypothetical protein